MEKRYQIFVSSTYADLKDERRNVIQTLMEMDCIPAGMELFPAADEDQWAFIKKIIDDCDYYLLIIGGRYGSTTAEGISFTEKEYDYAVERGLKVIALIHENPDEIPSDKVESDPEARERLKAFRDKVAKGRMVKQWKTADQIPGFVALSLQKTMTTYPAVGWVRANRVSDESLLLELNEVRKENARLTQVLAEIQTSSQVSEIKDLAGLDEKVTLNGHCSYYRQSERGTRSWSVDISWRDLFLILAPYLINFPTDDSVKQFLCNQLFRLSKAKDSTGITGKSLDEQDFYTVRIQLTAQGLVNVKYTKTTTGGMAVFWSSTPQGNNLMYQMRTVKKAEEKEK